MVHTTRIAVLVGCVAIAAGALGGAALGVGEGDHVTVCATEGGNVVWKGGDCKANETSLRLAAADALTALQARVGVLEADALEREQRIVALQEIVGMNGATLDDLQEVVGMNGATLDELQEVVGMNGATLDDVVQRIEGLESIVGMNG